MLRFISAWSLLIALAYAENKLASTLSSTVDGQALFVRNETPHGVNNNRPVRQGSSTMDQTVQNILQWLQGKYTQNNRIARQQVPSRQYLPSLPGASTTQRPRPFQTSAPTFPPQQPSIPSGSGNVDINVKGYPYQDAPTPEFNLPQRPSSTYQPSTSYQPSTVYDQPSSYQPSVQSTYQPPQSTYQPSTYEPPSFPTSTGFQPSGPPGIPSSPGIPGISSGPGIPSQPPSAPDVPTAPGFPSSPDFFSPGPTAPGNYPSPSPSPSGTSEGETIFSGNEIDSDTAHPPHIHAINVQCSKDRMTIDIEFNRQFDGVIYSKGYYGSQECRYVAPNSGQTKYTFTVMLNSCGTQFIDGFSEGKQAYLENVLVLQNEPGIQEVWDSVRSVRCLWEGNLNKALSVALSVDMLNQEVVTFSGDTATAKLDIQVGRGPFAPLANGLVKIGEPMTLVVTVEGDPAFNVLVRECIARDNDPNSGNVVKLTDEQGCVLKPKLIGAFQTTRNPETNSIIAYAFFQAFKFPDVMDLTIECNVELCKTDCQPCSNPNQKLEPGKRRRRDISNSSSIIDPVTLGRRLRVYLPEDIEQSSTGNTPVVINVSTMSEQSKLSDSVCLSTSVFITTFTILLGTLTASCLATVNLWFKLQRSSANKK